MCAKCRSYTFNERSLLTARGRIKMSWHYESSATIDFGGRYIELSREDLI